MPDLSIVDLVTPYVLRAVDLGAWHPALSSLAVYEHESSVSSEGVVIRGIVHLHGNAKPYFDLDRMVFGIDLANEENHPMHDTARRNPWIDVHDTKIEFQLTVQRAESLKVSGAVATINAPAFNVVRNVLQQYDTQLGDPPPSDYPTTAFSLDFILTSIVLRPPFLRGAKRTAEGQLVPDPANQEVRFTLPKIKLRLSQGSNVNDPLNATLLSLGATGLDDPGDLGVAEMITMEPPYAFIGDTNVVGFGFRTAILDLSNGSTPPDVLAQFGYDASWTGLYLPEIRLFVAPNGARDLAIDAGARNLLIGFGQSGGVTGDFELQILNQGDGPIGLGARFYDSMERGFGITKASDTEASVQLPALTRMVVDVDGGRAPFEVKARWKNTDHDGREHTIDLTNDTTLDIEITATDASGEPNKKTLLIHASRMPVADGPPAGTQPAAQIPPVELRTLSVKRGDQDAGTPRLQLIGETASKATIGLTSGESATWTVAGQPAPGGTTIEVDVAPGQTVAVTAHIAAGPALNKFTAFYRYDHPKPGSGAAYATIPANSRTGYAPDEGASTVWSAGEDSMTALAGLLKNADSSQAIAIKGYASYEGIDTPQSRGYNTALSQRRAEGLEAMIRKLMADGGPLEGKTFQFTPAPAAEMGAWTSQGTTLETRREWWKAVATFPGGISAPGLTIQGELKRRPVEPPPVQPEIVVPDPPPAGDPPAQPDFFRQLGGKVRIVRNQFVACEIFAKFDIQTATEDRLQQAGGPIPANTTLPAWRAIGSNPADGLVDLRLVVQIDDASNEVTVTLYFGADPADKDGLYLLEPAAGEEPGFGLNLLGASCVLLPVVAAGSAAVANNGAGAELAVQGGALLALAGIAGLEWLRTERIIWYGGEAKVVANAAGEWEASVLLDIETTISADFLGLIEIPRESPLSVRYKAIGFMFGDPTGKDNYVFRPIFDSSRGYTIDVSRPGAIKVKEPIGKILQILGARIAKNNPTILEIDLGFAIDLSVLTVERAKIRATLHNEADPSSIGNIELTAFAAGVDIPGALRGRGSLEVGEGKFIGQLDLTIVPVKVRIAAGVGIEEIPADKGGPATGVIVALDVSFPVAIPLGGSGLGIYGFLGLFAMHWTRKEDGLPADVQAPALAWLRATNGNPLDLNWWKAKANNWAFGVGALLGTMGSSVVFNLKGMFLLELPGPRLLLLMKANLLIPMPERKGPSEGLIMAVIDLDMARETLTIGLYIEFKIEFLLKIRIPVEAFFNFQEPKDWHLYLGQYKDMVQADILQAFEGCGYLMISGNGISDIPSLPAVTGFSIATGLHVSFIWGSKGAGLYAELAAGFDAIVGFDPFRFAGILYVRGTLHLWIIDISAWAKLKVDMGEDANGNKLSLISGEICGEVEFLFFTVSGCVDFAVGESAGLPAPPKLVKSLRLISRSPALAVGTGIDRPIDAGIGEGTESPNDEKIPVVPIDAIPLLMMSAPPLHDGVQFKGSDLQSSNGAPVDGWVARGDTYYKYKLKTVELSGPLTAGTTPATWWEPKTEKALEAQLALLSWIPEATPKAVEYSKYLEDWVKEHWGTICSPIAPPAPVLWTFLREAIGPSPQGWWLDGKAWPDPPNTLRTGPVDIWMKVTERWRSGSHKLDQLRGVVPAVVEGAAVYCPPKPTTTPPRLKSGITAPTAIAPLRAPRERVDVIGAARGRKTTDRLSLTPSTRKDLIKAIESGLPVSRSAYTPLTPVPAAASSEFAGSTAAAATQPRNCQSRVLAAPLLDDFWRATSNPATYREKYIQQQLKKRNYKTGPLIDAVTIRTGEFAYTLLYLFVPRMVLAANQLVAVLMNDQEQILATRVITSADVTPLSAFPSRWTDPAGPWQAEIFLLSQHQQLLEPRGFQGVVLRVDGKAGADRVQIGLQKNAAEMLKGFLRRPYYVAAVETLRSAEVWRYDYEVKEQSKKKEAAGTVLNAETANYALLQKDQLYSVTATWEVERERRPQGESPQDKSGVLTGSATYHFRTDKFSPKRLDPWMLASLPEENERHYFADDGMKLVFGTNNVVRIWDTYDQRLQVRLKASSGRQTEEANSQIPIVLDFDNVKPVSQSILEPFEEALQNALGSCVPANETRIRHSLIDIKTPLDTFTDYVLDIEVVPKNAPQSARGPSVWRRGFSTGRYRSLEAFAQSFFEAKVEHRYVEAQKLQNIGLLYSSKSPEGNEFDRGLIEAGLEPMEVPTRPRLIVFWQTVGGADPQPAAMIVDSSEPLWRSRVLPKEAFDNTANDGNKRYELTRTPWLSLRAQTGGSPAADDIVAHIVPAPGGQRALITFNSNSRGRHLRLSLVRLKQTEPYLEGPAADEYLPIADLTFSRAPWEEEE